MKVLVTELIWPEGLEELEASGVSRNRGNTLTPRLPRARDAVEFWLCEARAQ